MSPTQRRLPEKTQRPQETDIHAAGGIRTRSPSKRASADLRLKPRGRQDRRSVYSDYNNTANLTAVTLFDRARNWALFMLR